MKTALLLLTLLAIPSLGLAADWGACTTANEAITKRPLPGAAFCADLSSGDLATAILDVTACDTIDIVYESDMSGAGTAISAQILSCVSASASTNTCKAIENTTLAGTASSFELRGIGAMWVYGQGSGTIGSENPRIAIGCKGPTP